MASPELQRLYRLHQLDAQIASARARISALDGGKAKISALKATKAKLDVSEATYHEADGSLTDAGLERQTLLTKADAVEKEMYSGTLSGARAIEDRERQIASLRGQAETIEARLSEMQARSAGARADAEGLKSEFEAERKEAALEVKRQQATAEKLATALKEWEPKREELTAVVPATLLAKYDAIRTRHKGIGMADVTRDRTCSMCGTAVPERAMTSLIAERTVTCESCGRILYYTLGVI